MKFKVSATFAQITNIKAKFLTVGLHSKWISVSEVVRSKLLYTEYAFYKKKKKKKFFYDYG
jgi:hypothetical protein